MGAKKKISGRNTIFWLGIAITFCLPLVLILMPGFLSHFNGKLYDTFLTRTDQGALSERIVIVDVDDDSLLAHGQWPWPRYKIAAMLDMLHDAGAAAIGIDVMFPEKDRTSLPRILADIRQDLGLSIEFANPPVLPDNDHFLAEAISRSKAVLGYQFLFHDAPAHPDCRLHPLHLATPDSLPEALRFSWRANHVICNLQLFQENTESSGFFNAAPDADGILRRVPLIISYRDRLYPSLALATVMNALNVREIGLIQRIDDFELVVGRIRVPLDAHGSALLRYRGKSRSYPYISAADLLSGRVPNDKIQNKIVFIGTTAAGLKEFRSTPTDPIFPGVEINATMADNLLSADFLSRPPSAPGIELIIALLFGTGYVLATRKTGAFRGFLVYSTATAALLLAALFLFHSKGVYLSPILPVIVLTANFTVLNLFSRRREEMKSRQYAHDLTLAQGAIIESMAALTESRDRETGGHIKRTQKYVHLLAIALREDRAFRPVLTDEMVALLCKSAPLHDIGKVGISDRILLKPGALSPEEYEEIKKHTTIGKAVIDSVREKLGDHPFIEIAREMIHTHHEKWDGTGYPQGLKSSQIPLSGRIMAIVDMYDALTSKRVYKEAVSHERAVQIMIECAAGFDPRILSRFLVISNQFKNISINYADP